MKITANIEEEIIRAKFEERNIAKRRKTSKIESADQVQVDQVRDAAMCP